MSLPAAALISGDRRLLLSELEDRVARAATGFMNAGIGEGSAVAILMRNDFAFFEATLAAGRIGAYATPINWHFTADEVAYILGDSGAQALVVHSDLVARVADVLPPALRVFVVPTPPEIRQAYGLPEDDGPLPEGAEDWNAWLAQQPAATVETRPPPASMIYTSGTTGRPKGVRRVRPTPEQMATTQVRAAKFFGLQPGRPTVVLMNGPMYHSAPCGYGIQSIRAGASVVLQARFDAEDMLALIDAHRVTHMHIVPTMFVRLLKLAPEVRERHDLGSLEFVVHGAAPCAVHVKRAMIDWWGPVINEYYGSTETGIPVFHGAEEALRKPGTVGRALEGCVVKVFAEDGSECAPGEIGEIYLRARYVSDFTYQHNDDKRREVGRGDLVTVGDVGYVDADGYVFLCDRKRDMVISGGVNIYPAEIESVLIGMPGVRDCAVFGIPDEEFGEVLCAHVEAESALTADAVRAFLATRVAGFKVPRIVEFAAALPREDSGKIFKRKLRAPYWEGAGRLI
ncbi:MAG: acyl-CoA synthetase [Caldimonas sp.]